MGYRWVKSNEVKSFQRAVYGDDCCLTVCQSDLYPTDDMVIHLSYERLDGYIKSVRSTYLVPPRTGSASCSRHFSPWTWNRIAPACGSNAKLVVRVVALETWNLVAPPP
jgi:hypothetical protein